VLSFIRWGDHGEHLVVACNFTPVARTGYRIGVPWPCFYEEVLNTDSEIYGGANLGNGGGLWADNWAMHGHYHSLALTLPPLSCVVLKPRKAEATIGRQLSPFHSASDRALLRHALREEPVPCRHPRPPVFPSNPAHGCRRCFSCCCQPPSEPP
jgi:hypothetical protein